MAKARVKRTLSNEPLQHTGGPSWLQETAYFVRRGFNPSAVGNWDPEFIRATLKPGLYLRDQYYHGRVEGFAKLPKGPFMLVGMHGGGPMNVLADNLVLMTSWYEYTQCARPLYVMTHHIAFHLGPIGRFMARYGAIDGNMRAAHAVLEAGHGFCVFPGGEEDMARPFWSRNQVNFRGHTGFARVALETGVPIYPLAEYGGHEVEMVLAPGRKLAHALHLPRLVGLKTFPIALTIPWGLTIGYLPYIPLPARIVQRIGKPLRFTPSAQERADPQYLAHVRDTVQAAVQKLTNKLVRDESVR
jgi:1-acyl-sn-glycerol-3-phosphate acyltransferase